MINYNSFNKCDKSFGALLKYENDIFLILNEPVLYG